MRRVKKPHIYRVLRAVGQWSTAFIALVLLISSCSSSPGVGWSKPFEDTTCAEFRGEMTTPQRQAMARHFLAELANPAASPSELTDDKVSSFSDAINRACRDGIPILAEEQQIRPDDPAKLAAEIILRLEQMLPPTESLLPAPSHSTANSRLCGRGDTSLTSIAAGLERTDATTDTSALSRSIVAALGDLRSATVDASAETARDAVVVALEQFQSVADNIARAQVARAVAAAIRTFERQLCE